VTTDENGHRQASYSDAYGRLITVEELNNGATYTTTYQYDPLNHLVQVTDHAGHLTRLTYDSLGRKLSMVDPDMGPWSYTYDAVDNLATQTDARGVVTTFTYDVLNRLKSKSYTIPPGSGIPNPGGVLYQYDEVSYNNPFPKGKLTSLSDGVGASTFIYDNLGRLTQEIRVIGGSSSYTISRAYDLLGRLTSLKYPDQESALYTYNAQGGLETISLKPIQGQPTPIVTDVDYNAAGQITKLVYGNGTVSDYTYNPLTLRLDTLKTTGPSGTLQDFSYGFDAVGNVTGITDRIHSATQSFQYDPLNRLTAATGSYGAVSYAYDPLGNMTTKEGVAMTYGEQGAGPHAVTSTAAGWTMTYDANGNMLAKTPQGADGALMAQQLVYDVENRLVRVDTPDTKTVTLTLQPGWNFFSLPVIPDDASIASLLPNFSSDFEQLSTLGSSLSTFLHYVGVAKFDDFTELEYGQGYQLYCKAQSPVTVTLTGHVPTTQATPTLTAGWHLLPSIATGDTSLTVGQVFTGIAYGRILRYDPSSGSLTSVNPNDPALIGQAYYVEVLSASTWTPPLPKDVTTQFVYDGDGGRATQITPRGTTTYLGESYEIAPNGTKTKYVFAGSQRLAAKDSTGALRFYHTDHLGSSNVITDATGALVELAEYSPYGSLSRHEGSANVPQKFTGKRLDASTGLYFYSSRYYDPSLGRFIQADSVVPSAGDPQALNRYSYVRNNPLKYADPSGHSFWSKFFGGIAAAITFVASGGNIALAAGVFGAVDGGISAAQAGASGGGILKSAAIGFTAGFVGGAIGGAVAGTVGGLSSSYVGGFVGGAVGGAAAGATGAALSGGDVLRSAGAGAASGAVFGAYANISLPVAMLGSAVVGAVAAGEDPVDALVEGAGSYAGTYVGGYAAGYARGRTVPQNGQLEPMGVQKGDQLFYLGQPLDIGKILVGLFEGPISHTNIYVGNGQVADNSWGRPADIVSLTRAQFQGRRFISFRGASGAANLNYNALTSNYASGNGQYNPATLNVCSTFCSAIYSGGGVSYPNGIGPNAQFINRLRDQ